MNPWGPYGIPAWMSIWADMLSVLADPFELKPQPRSDEQIEAEVLELKEDLKLLTPDDLTKGRGR